MPTLHQGLARCQLTQNFMGLAERPQTAKICFTYYRQHANRPTKGTSTYHMGNQQRSNARLFSFMRVSSSATRAFILARAAPALASPPTPPLPEPPTPLALDAAAAAGDVLESFRRSPSRSDCREHTSPLKTGLTLCGLGGYISRKQQLTPFRCFYRGSSTAISWSAPS